MVGIVADELATVVVVAEAILAAARLGAEVERARVEPEILGGDLDGLEVGPLQAADGAAPAGAGLEVDAVVEEEILGSMGSSGTVNSTVSVQEPPALTVKE